jgi:hypothetical protein
MSTKWPHWYVHALRTRKALRIRIFWWLWGAIVSRMRIRIVGKKFPYNIFYPEVLNVNNISTYTNKDTLENNKRIIY